MAFRPPRLGPGAVYLRSLEGLFRSNGDLIRVAEVEPQSLWTKGTAPDSVPRGSPAEMRRLAGTGLPRPSKQEGTSHGSTAPGNLLPALPQWLLTHGVGYPIGGTVCDQDRHIPEFRRWTEGLGSPWTSEHLSILEVRGANGSQPCGFLMPPLQTEAQAELAATNIKRRADAVGLPFAFETGVNYFAPRACEMPDGDFFATVAEAADCGILLDLNNLWINDRNGRAKIGDVLARMPLERVWEVHLAGMEFSHGYWVDAHCGAIDPDLQELAAEVVASLPNLGAIVFEIAPDRIPVFGAAAFLRQIETLHRLWATAPSAARIRVVERHPPRSGPPAPTPEQWERLIADRMLPPAGRPAATGALLETRTEDEQSFSVYVCMAASFRRGAIASLLETTTRLLLIAMGEDMLRDLLDRYISVTPPVAFPTDEALAFRRFMDAYPISVPGFDEMLKFEAALIEAAADSTTIKVTVHKDIDAMLTDIAAGRLPGPSSDCSATVLEIGVDPAPFVRMAGAA